MIIIKTVLFYACENKNLELFRLLQKNYEFDYDEQDDEGRTILHYACSTKNFDLVQTIISLGAITTIKDNKDSTILHYACKKGNYDIVSFLINRGELNINDKDKKGNTPYIYALESEKSKLIEYLESLPGIDLTKPKEESSYDDDLNDSFDDDDDLNDSFDDDDDFNDSSKDDDLDSISNSFEEEEEEAELQEEEEKQELKSKKSKKSKGNNMKIKEKNSLEYGKMLFMKAIKYLKISTGNSSENISEFVTKHIKELNIDYQHENENNNNDNDDENELNNDQNYVFKILEKTL